MGTVKKMARFVRETAAGLGSDEFRRLFNQEAARTYSVLARDQASASEPAGGVKRAWYRAKVVIRGLAAKLTPARRLLFIVSLGVVLVGLIHVDYSTAAGHVVIDLSPGLVLLGVAGLVYLLALELTDRILIRDELEVARELQSDLLPDAAPDVAGWRFAHSYRTANEVGGDYYDFPILPDGRLAVIAGDASGHGMAAGLVMAIANATLEIALDQDPAPAKVAALLNRTLWHTGTRRNFMTLFYALVEPSTGRAEYVCAGHPFPLLRRADGSVHELGTGGFPLGVRPELELAEASVELGPGDLLVVYSDGLPETRDRDGKPFGYERVRQVVAAGGDAASVHAGLLAALDRMRGDEPLVDDVSLVVIERTAPAA